MLSGLFDETPDRSSRGRCRRSRAKTYELNEIYEESYRVPYLISFLSSISYWFPREGAPHERLLGSRQKGVYKLLI